MSEDAADGRHAPRREESPTGDGRTADADARLDGPFDALADARCRTVVRHLAGTEGKTASLVDLYPRHLPKLAAAGLVEYDARSRTVRYHGAPVGSWLDRVDTEGCR